MTPQLLLQIRQVSLLLPPLALSPVTHLLASRSQPCSERLKTQVLNQLPNPKFRRLVADLFATWQQDTEQWDSRAIAAALMAAADASTTAREALDIELVWTGPESTVVPVRRTDRVLLQLIAQAQQEVITISFAVYKIPEIADALVAALNRGVNVRIIAETPASGASRIPYGVKAALGAQVLERSLLFTWPVEQRPKNAEGNCGSLHIKGCIVDSQHLFVTSANLTEYALTLNMEMGLLVHSQALATQVVQLLDSLIQQGVLVTVHGSA